VSSTPAGRVAAVTALACCLTQPLSSGGEAPVRPGVSAAPGELPDPLPLDPQVKDPVFSVLVGLIRSNLYGSLTQQRLQRAVSGQRGQSRLPYRHLRELRRVAGPAGTAQVTLVLDGDLKLPVPYTILWYHPGRFLTSETCFFREWILGPMTVPVAAAREGQPATTVELQDVHLFALDHGRIAVDVDAWLDRLMGSALDDTVVTGILLFRRSGRWLAVAVGYNNDGKGRTGTFDFAEDRIVFPVPADMKAVARQMRAQMEALMASPAPTGPEGLPLP
jgi:hypothetical protein